MDKNRRAFIAIAFLTLTACTPSPAKKTADASRSTEVARVQSALQALPGVVAATVSYSSGIDSGNGAAIRFTVAPPTTQTAAHALVEKAAETVWRSTIAPVDSVGVLVLPKDSKTALEETSVVFSEKATFDRLAAAYGSRPVPQPSPTR